MGWLGLTLGRFGLELICARCAARFCSGFSVVCGVVAELFFAPHLAQISDPKSTLNPLNSIQDISPLLSLNAYLLLTAFRAKLVILGMRDAASQPRPPAWPRTGPLLPGQLTCLEAHDMRGGLVLSRGEQKSWG